MLQNGEAHCVLRRLRPPRGREPDTQRVQVAGALRPDKRRRRRSAATVRSSRKVHGSSCRAGGRAGRLTSEGGDVIDGGGNRAGSEPRRQGHRLRRRHRPHPLPVLPAGSGDHDRLRPGAFDRAVGAHLDGGAVDPEAAGVLGLPDRAAGRDDAAARAQHLDDAPHPVARRTGADGGGLHHRRLRAPGDERRFRHRHHRLPHSGDDQLPRHHQGRDPYRRGRARASPSTPFPASRWRSTPTSPPASSTRRWRSSAGASSRRKAPSSARWTAPRNSSAATRSPASSFSPSTFSAASSSASPAMA